MRFFALGMLASLSVAAPVTWDGGGATNNWSEAANWNPDGVPTAADDVTFDATSLKNCVIDVPVTILSLNVAAAYTGTISGAGRLTISGAFTHSGGTFTHGGTVVLSGSAASTLTVSATTSFTNLAINDGLIGYWKLDETAGPSLDSSGYGQSGAWVNTPTGLADAPSVNFTDPGSARFDGATEPDHIQVPRTPVLEPPVSLGGGAVTVACWVKRDGIATEGTRWAALFRKSWQNNSAPSYGSYALQLPQGNYSTVAFGTGHTTGVHDIYSTAGTIPDQTWVHVAGVFDPSGPAPQKRLYINGTLNAATDVGSPFLSEPIVYDTDVDANGSGDLYIGHTGSTGATQERLNGQVDDLRVYGRALTHQEIQALAIGNQPGIGSTATPNRTLGGGALDVNGNLVLNAGSLSAGGQDVRVAGSWLNHGGVFVPGAGTAILDGASATSLIQTGGQPFGNLRVDGAGTWTLNDRMGVGGTLTIAGGTLDVSTRNYVVHAGLVNQTGGTFVPGTGTVVLESTTGGSFRFTSPPNNLRIEDPNEGGLVGYWKFDEGQRTTTFDHSGSGNNGSLTFFPPIPVAPTRPVPFWSNTSAPVTFDNAQSIDFDGVDDFVVVLDNVSLNPTAAITVAAWIRADTWTPGGSNNPRVVQKAGDEQYRLTAEGGVFKWHVFGAGEATSALPTTGTWHHVAGTYDDAADTLSLFIDGVLASTIAVPGAVPIPVTAFNLHIGTKDSTAPQGDYFDGHIDDVRIYNVALPPAQIANLAAGRYADGRNGTATFVSGGPLTVNGAFTIDSGIYNADIHPTTLAMPFTLLPGNGEYQAGSGLQFFDGALAPLTITGSRFTAGTGTVLVDGPMLVNGGTVTGLSGAGLLDVNGNLTVSSGTFNGGSGTIDVDGAFALSGGSFTTTSGMMFVSGNFTVSGTPTFSAPAGTVTLDGLAIATLTTGNVAFYNVTIDKTDGPPDDVVTLVGNLAAAGSLSVITGTLDMATGSVSVGDAITVNGTLLQRSGNITSGTGAFTVALGGRWENRDVGDVFVGSGGVLNNGVIYMDGGGGGCAPGANPILIRSTVPTVQRLWTVGATGFFRFYDVDVQDQNATSALTVFEGTNSFNNTNWLFSGSCPNFSVAVSAISGPTTEALGTATFTMVLTVQPFADVSVTVTSLDTTEGTVTTAQPITFTSANWSTPRTVTVQGVNDDVDDGDILYTINTSAAVSSDPDFAGLDPINLSVTNLDDDTAGVVVAPVFGLLTSEGGLADFFTVVLASEPTASLTIGVSSSDPTEGSVAPGSFVFTNANWNVPQTVTVTGLNDAIVDGNIPYTVITAPPAGGDIAYSVINPADVRVTSVDDDAPGITVSPVSGLWTTEGGGVTLFRVVLNQAPAAGTDVVVPVMSSDITEGLAFPLSLTFTPANFGTPQVVGIVGQDDGSTDGNQPYTVRVDPAVSADPNYSGLDATDVSLLNLDDDEDAISIIPASGLVTTERGGSDVFFVVLNRAPVGGNVSFTLSSGDLTEGTLLPGALTFTPANGLIPRTVVVTGVNDALVDGNVAYAIVTSAATGPGGYGGLNPPDVSVTNLDNDGAAIGVSPVSGLTTSEAGGTATFMVSLAQEPTSDVTVSLASGNPAEGTISVTTLDFAQANWFVSQIVTVTGVDDAASDGDVGYVIVTSPALSADPAYSGLNPSDVSVTNLDNEVPPELDRVWGGCGASCAGAPPIPGWAVALLFAALVVLCRRRSI